MLIKTQPFSDNVIFFDTEFTHLDLKKGELLSIAMIKPSGEELYLEFAHEKDVDPWVVDNVLPYMEGVTFSKEEARKLIRQFIGETQPFLLSYVNQFDAMYWYDLFESTTEHPVFRIPLDFASILFAYGLPPNSFSNPNFLKWLGIHIDYAHRGHNALDDARILRDAYTRFMIKVSENSDKAA